MPGLEDVQPKQLSSLGQPLVSEMAPVATVSAVERFADAFRKGQITAFDIAERTSDTTQAKQRAELQVAREMVSPEAIEARKEAVKLASQKAEQERETMFDQESIAYYKKFNGTLYGPDGKPDNRGMAEVGRKYGDMDRLRQYALMGVTPVKEIPWVDKQGNKRITVYNALSQDITQEPGKTNAILVSHQKNLDKATSFLLHNTEEPSGEGESFLGKPSPVQPKQAAPIQDAPAAPMVTSIAPEPFQYVPEGSVQAAPVSVDVVPKPPAPPAAPVVVAPKTESVPTEQPMYEPGSGRVVGISDESVKLADSARKMQPYETWTNKKDTIENFRATVQTYPKTGPTTQSDIALATAALLLTAPGATAGGRGMEGMRLKSLEDSVPRIEQLIDWKGIVLHDDKFPEPVRNRIIALTEQKAKIIENGARDVVKYIQTNAPGVPLIDYEQKLLSGDSSGSVAGAPASGSAVSGPLTLGNRKFRATFKPLGQ